jgi:beta-glucosidase
VRLDKGEKIVAHVRIKNTGKIAGKEVVQLYLSDEASTLHKPPKELKAFQKVYLEPGEEKEVSFALSKDDLASFDVALDRWVTEPGYYQILIGNSSRNIVLTGRFKAECENPYGYGPDAGIGKLMGDPRAVEVIKTHTGVEPSAVIGMDLIFAPKMKFSDVWEKSFVPALAGKTAKERALIQQAVYAELGNIDLTEQPLSAQNPLQDFTDATLPG